MFSIRLETIEACFAYISSIEFDINYKIFIEQF